MTRAEFLEAINHLSDDQIEALLNTLPKTVDVPPFDLDAFNATIAQLLEGLSEAEIAEWIATMEGKSPPSRQDL